MLAKVRITSLSSSANPRNNDNLTEGFYKQKHFGIDRKTSRFNTETEHLS
jgi:hypothetical protein